MTSKIFSERQRRKKTEKIGRDDAGTKREREGLGRDDNPYDVNG